MPRPDWPDAGDSGATYVTKTADVIDDAQTTLDDHEARVVAAESDIDDLEAIDAGTRLDAVEAIDAGTRLTTIETDGATLTGTETLTNKTLTSPKLNEDVALTATATELNSHESLISTASGRVDLLQYRRPTIAALGDSITSNGLNNGGGGSKSWLTHACVASGGKMHWVDNVGGGGYTTAQILSTLIPVVLTRDPRPGYCCVLAGANDTDVTSFASWSASYTAILDALTESGIVPVICPITPNSNANKHEDAATWNAWLNLQAKSRGIPYANWLPDLMDPTTGGDWLSGLDADGVHPNGDGAQAMGDALWRELQTWIDAQPAWTPYLATSNTDPTNLHLNGLFLTDTNADGLADNLNGTEGGAGVFTDYVTPTLENPSSGDCIGKWQQLARIGSGASYVNVYTQNIIAASPGDRLSLAFRIKTSDIVSSGVGWGQTGLMQWISTTIPAGNVDGASGSRNLWWTNGWGHDIDAMTVYQEFTARSSVTTGVGFIIGLGVNADSGTISIAQLTVRNLTALGIA